MRKQKQKPKAKPEPPYRFIQPSPETWAKVGRLVEQRQAEYPFKLNINRLATIEFERAIAAIPEPDDAGTLRGRTE